MASTSPVSTPYGQLVLGHSAEHKSLSRLGIRRFRWPRPVRSSSASRPQGTRSEAALSEPTQGPASKGFGRTFRALQRRNCGSKAIYGPQGFLTIRDSAWIQAAGFLEATATHWRAYYNTSSAHP
jgi:hypothetical protein